MPLLAKIKSPLPGIIIARYCSLQDKICTLLFVVIDGIVEAAQRWCCRDVAAETFYLIASSRPSRNTSVNLHAEFELGKVVAISECAWLLAKLHWLAANKCFEALYL